MRGSENRLPLKRSRGGMMPEVYNITEYPEVEVYVKFRGKRGWHLWRWYPFCWIPYITGSRPSIAFRISLKDDKYWIGVEGFHITHDNVPPAPGIASLVWPPYQQIEGKLDYTYSVPLPPLINSGQHNYYISIPLEYEHKGTPSRKPRGGIIMSTGYVPYKEKISIGSVVILLPLLGACLALLIEHVAF